MASKVLTDGSGDMDMAEVPLDFEEDLAQASSSSPDSKFDVTIGHIEDLIMEDEFQQLQQDFMDKHYLEFEDQEENKFIHTEIHKEYIDLIEKYLLTNLAERMDDFVMAEFHRELVKRKEELVGEVFEMLLTFSDFLAFKEMFIDYRNAKEGNVVDLSEGLVVRSLRQDPAQALAINSMQLPMTSQAPANGTQCASQENAGVHSLEVGGQSFMISTPGASNGTIDWGPAPVQINRVNSSGVSHSNNVSSSGVNSESMNISPRLEQMDE